MEKFSFIVSKEDWSLHRKGYVDQQRHMKKVKEAIKKNLADIVSEESIIMSDGKKIVKVPIRSLEEYRFRFNLNKQEHVGQGKGKTKPGDILGSDSARGSGKSGGAGDEPGVDYYEAEITVDELAELIFEDLGLPNLQEKEQPEMVSESIEFKDVRKKGIMSNIDKRRTLLESIRRNAREGSSELKIIPDDLRFKTWETEIKHQSSAVVIAMMDTSGSMGPFEKYIARSFFFWMVRFLRTKYKNVQIVFLAHHTTAKEVTEQEFFTKGESGGTRCSSVYELALKIIEERYPVSDYNIYPFHFSDGDNLPSDNEKCLRLVNRLLDVCNIFGYGEIEGLYYNSSSLMKVYQQIKNPRFTSVLIKDKSGVYPALRAFFNPKRDVFQV
ncbi:sporulation protein YhbH [Thermincola potens]|uniref:Sporulation protein YhbH n=1 Tax=Thermincola potens (strain JR) TaxID=635013 RepID=D5X8G2_THEPJ|nr:sporulation protein YhbH [Thermincola potens]ADG82838.1 sporulation protein YhbH [Thermincola potens JR]